MERAGRRRVRQRDGRFGPQSRAGAHAGDTFQTIIATALKRGVRVEDYLLKRRVAPNATPARADHIRERAGAAACSILA